MATSSSRRSHPGRTLIIFFFTMAALFGLVWLGKTWSPRLGLDLRGGTTVTLTARNLTGGGAVSRDSLLLAQSIIQQRVDAMGVGNVTVAPQGDNHLVVTAPNVQGDQLVKLVGQTAQLYFRNVYMVAQSTLPASASPGASTSPTPTKQPPGLPVAPYAGPPGLPSAPAVDPEDRPSTPAAKQPTIEQVLAWQPSQIDQAQFQTWNCGDEFPDVPDQPLFACDDQGYKYLLGPAAISGRRITKASSGIPQGQLSYAVTLDFDGAGTKQFLQATTYLATQQAPMNQFAVVLDGRVVSAPSVSTAIAGGQAKIDGPGITEQSSRELANVLKYGALPLAFDVSDVSTISANLGSDQLRAGIIAGLIGLLLVLIYSFAYYRGLGIVVVASLAIAGLTTYAMIVLLGHAIGFALDLPGIAGAIVAIGVTADSFIIYFERIRDEIRDGRSLRTAIETGWRLARPTLVISDLVSVLSAVVLYVLAVGGVRGFAFTLGLTTLIDLALVFFFTHPLMSVLGRTRFFGEGHPLSGLSAGHMGVSRDSLLGRRARASRRERRTDRVAVSATSGRTKDVDATSDEADGALVDADKVDQSADGATDLDTDAGTTLEVAGTDSTGSVGDEAAAEADLDDAEAAEPDESTTSEPTARSSRNTTTRNGRSRGGRGGRSGGRKR